MKQQDAKEFAGVDQYVRGFRDGQVVSEEIVKLHEDCLSDARKVILLESAALLMFVLIGWAMGWPWITAKFQGFIASMRTW